MYSAPEPETTISIGVSDTPMLEIGLASVKYTFSTATWLVGEAKSESWVELCLCHHYLKKPYSLSKDTFITVDLKLFFRF